MTDQNVDGQGGQRERASGDVPDDDLLALRAGLARLRANELAVPDIFRAHEEAARMMLELQRRAEHASRVALHEAGEAGAAQERDALAHMHDHRRSAALSFVAMLAGLTAAIAPAPEWVGQVGTIFAVLGLAIGLNEGYLYVLRKLSR